jgi:hypothetical protein
MESGSNSTALDAVINLVDSVQNITLTNIPQATIIDSTTLLQEDASVMVGIFIFLTLQNFKGET